MNAAAVEDRFCLDPMRVIAMLTDRRRRSPRYSDTCVVSSQGQTGSKLFGCVARCNSWVRQLVARRPKLATLRTAVRPFKDCSSSMPSTGGGMTPMRPRVSKPSRTLWLSAGRPASRPGTAITAVGGAALLAIDETWVLGGVAALDRGSGPDPDPAALLPLLALTLKRAVSAALRGSSPDPSSPAKHRDMQGQHRFRGGIWRFEAGSMTFPSNMESPELNSHPSELNASMQSVGDVLQLAWLGNNNAAHSGSQVEPQALQVLWVSQQGTRLVTKERSKIRYMQMAVTSINPRETRTSPEEVTVGTADADFSSCTAAMVSARGCECGIDETPTLSEGPCWPSNDGRAAPGTVSEAARLATAAFTAFCLSEAWTTKRQAILHWRDAGQRWQANNTMRQLQVHRLMFARLEATASRNRGAASMQGQPHDAAS